MRIEKIRQDFPILSQQVNRHPLVYLDNAATTQKPVCVIDALSGFFNTVNSNVHRGVHFLSQKATDEYERAREKVRSFLHARSSNEIIFTRGTTESINLVASSYGHAVFKSGDEVILTEMEHHSNIVPWQLICEQKGAIIKVVSINDSGELDMEHYKKLLSAHTRMVAVTHASNVLGTVNPLKEIIALAHQKDIPVLVDGAQAVPHLPVDVMDMDCDFYCFSGHKMYGPTGIGVLFGKEERLNGMPPYQGGGSMINSVTFAKTTYTGLPHKFEAGTPAIAEAIALGSAIDYIASIGFYFIQQYEDELSHYAVKKLSAIKDIRFIGTAKNRVPVFSFLLGAIHPYDTGTILDKFGIAVRTGHHCNQPLMDKFNIPGTVRASFSLYNTKQDVDRLVSGLQKARQLLSS